MVFRFITTDLEPGSICKGTFLLASQVIQGTLRCQGRNIGVFFSDCPRKDADGVWVRLDHEISAQLLVAWYCGEQVLDYSDSQNQSYQVDLTVWVWQPSGRGTSGNILGPGGFVSDKENAKKR